MINSYPSIYALGHAAIADLMKSPVIVEEKIDGSQISFEKRADNGEVECRSKGAQINMIAPEGMFKNAVEFVKSIADKLEPGITYRGEYLSKPKHNILCYSRIPANHIAIFDINTGLETYLSPEEKQKKASEIGLETVPVLKNALIGDPIGIRDLLETESMLGGQKIEGVVIKPSNYDLFGRDKKVLMGKFVSEEFKEIHASDWKKEHGRKSSNDILTELARQYATPARWQKALIHLKEEGRITDSLKDIESLIASVAPDVLKECEQELKDAFFSWGWPQLRRMLVRGLPEWYKETLLKKQFEDSRIVDLNDG